MDNIKPTLVISESAPPRVGGGVTSMRSLLRHFPKNSYSILTGDCRRDNIYLDEDSILDCKYYIADLHRALAAYRDNKYFKLFLECLLIIWVTLKGLYIVKKNCIENILATTYGGYEVGAYLTHKLTKTRLFVYFLDIYEESQLTGWGKFKARIMEKRLVNSATNIFVMSEYLREHILEKYGVKAIFIPHPIDSLFKYSNNDENKINTISKHKPFTIVYTGMIYEVQIEAILNMVKVVNLMPEGEMIFRVYSPRSVEKLQSMGINGRNVFCGFVSSNEIPNVQLSADALFLPFSFNSPYPMVIKTASPAKIAEYLAAGRPIIVNAPDYSYISHYAKTKGFGVVVNNLNSSELKNVILKLANDASICNQLTSNAKKTAQGHDGMMLSQMLQSYLNKH